jgi:sugar phosphate isomerase/epimerase
MNHTRRTFLGALTALPLAASLNLAGAGAASNRKFRLSLSVGSIGVNADQREALRLAGKHQFEAVDANANFFTPLTPDQVREINAERTQAGLTWGAAGLTVDFRGEEAAFQQGLQSLPKIAAALKQAGITRITTWISPGHSQLTYEQNLERHAQRLRAVSKAVNEQGLRLGLEYVGTKKSREKSPHPFVHDLKGMRELLGAIGVPGTGVVLDTWHWWTSGETAADILSLKNSDVVSVDLNDAPKGLARDEQLDGRRELPAATGVIPVAEFLGALVKIGYDGPVRAEPFNQPLNALDNEAACAAVSAAMHKAFALIPNP